MFDRLFRSLLIVLSVWALRALAEICFAVLLGGWVRGVFLLVAPAWWPDPTFLQIVAALALVRILVHVRTVVPIDTDRES